MSRLARLPAPGRRGAERSEEGVWDWRSLQRALCSERLDLDPILADLSDILVPTPAMMLIPALLHAAVSFQADAPHGTGLEWLTIASVVVPAVVLVALVYWGAQERR